MKYQCLKRGQSITAGKINGRYCLEIPMGIGNVPEYYPITIEEFDTFPWNYDQQKLYEIEARSSWKKQLPSNLELEKALLKGRQEPEGWFTVINKTVKELIYIGFSEKHAGKLVYISTSEMFLIDCDTAVVTTCSGRYDEEDFRAICNLPEEEKIFIAGIGGGIIRSTSNQKEHIEIVDAYNDKTQVVFLWKQEGAVLNYDKSIVVFDDYEFVASGFSRCGNYFVVAGNHKVVVYKRID